MARVLKVFGSAEERKQLAAKHKLLADYDAFTIMEVGDQQAKGSRGRISSRTSLSSTNFRSATPWPIRASLESPLAAWLAHTGPTKG
jgi:hypothetical protein